LLLLLLLLELLHLLGLHLLCFLFELFGLGLDLRDVGLDVLDAVVECILLGFQRTLCTFLVTLCGVVGTEIDDHFVDVLPFGAEVRAAAEWDLHGRARIERFDRLDGLVDLSLLFLKTVDFALQGFLVLPELLDLLCDLLHLSAAAATTEAHAGTSAMSTCVRFRPWRDPNSA
jgi:hypothetical protein